MSTPVSAHDVVAELRKQQPGMPTKKGHKMLYLCQGHHLAWYGEPLFAESIEAWDMGPVVADLWRAEKYGTPPPPRQELGERGLNTIGYVVSRYGSLTGTDLEILSHGQDPWRDADRHRQPRDAVRIEYDAMVRYFRADHEETSPGPEILAEVRRRIAAHPPVPDSIDDLEQLRARRDAYAAKLGVQ